MAAIEAVWTTPKAPAAWSIIAWPDQAQHRNLFALKIPYFLSLIATHSLTGTVTGEKQIIAHNVHRIQSGLKAYASLVAMRRGDATPAQIATYKENQSNLGFAFLLKRYDQSMTNVTPALVQKAANSSIPEVFTLFYSFRIMLLCWGLMLLLMLMGVYFSFKKTLHKHRWYLWCLLIGIPLPYIASEFGWVVAEVGRQPWTLHGYLPTYFSTSSIDIASVAFSLGGFVLFYCALFVVEIFLMFKYARLGPSSLGDGRYHYEHDKGDEQ